MIISEIKKAKVLVVGDLMLDRYIYGAVSRISPEAPVPVVKAAEMSETLGGAANVAHNIATLHANCTLVGTVGDDEYKASIVTMLETLGIKHNLLNAGLQTTTKIRLIGERQQIARIDYEDLIPENSQMFDAALDAVAELIDEHDIIVISDYGKGMISAKFSVSVAKLATQKCKMTIVDPKGSDWTKYIGVSLVTPNVKELSEVAGVKVRNEDRHVEEVGERIRKKYNLQYLVVTRSEKGVSILAENSVHHIPTHAQEVFDVSGAGDTVVATLACMLGIGADIVNAVNVANMAAGIVVRKMGTAPVHYEELYDVIDSVDTINSGYDAEIPLNILLDKVKIAKEQSRKVVFTNGCFDILHRGHVDYLRKAKKLGDILIVGLNSDASVKRLKGESRPVNKQADRAFVLNALADVDYVVIFDEDTPKELLNKIKPDILTKGGDYKVEDVIGREYAGEVKIIDFVNGYSTTSTIKRMC